MPQHDAVRGHETILVVEDDADVRLTVVDMLAQLGYKVITASSGEAALRVLDSETPIDLLFTDVIMPGRVKGGELGRRAALRAAVARAVHVRLRETRSSMRDGWTPA